jgi:hypothetical protein
MTFDLNQKLREMGRIPPDINPPWNNITLSRGKLEKLIASAQAAQREQDIHIVGNWPIARWAKDKIAAAIRGQETK